ncbi:MAG: hypothetical protein QMD05_04745, partial [Candidatus Brocadiaceae bacterium]|nr:hypothetical protein [Candidatus Brocadiaceae bacterium]
MTQELGKFVYCLCIDMKGSTKTGLNLPQSSLNRFNKKFAEEILQPHLGEQDEEKLGLANLLIKFTGDGWLLMTDKEEKIPGLCCLAIIMANTFQSEMSTGTNISTDKIPPLRLAICTGRDVIVNLPNKQRDWAGDSARSAVRASGYCYDNEILIDETVRKYIQRDFYWAVVDFMDPKRPASEKKEESFPLYTLMEINTETAADSDVPQCFIYTLQQIGKQNQALKTTELTTARIAKEVGSLNTFEEEKRRPYLKSWNLVMASLLDYSKVRELLAQMQKNNLTPDVYTYSILINKATDYEEAKGWLDEMKEK